MKQLFPWCAAIGLVLASAIGGDVRGLAAPAGQAAASAADEAAQRRTAEIQKLVTELLATDDLDRQEQLAKQILALDATIDLAVQRLAEVQAKRAAIEAQAKTEQEARRRASLRQQEIHVARRSFAAALAGGGAAPLEDARERVERVLADDPDNDEAQSLRLEIEAARASRRLRFWVAVGAASVGVLGALLAIVLRVRSAKRELRVLGGPQAGRRFPIGKDRITIGALAGDNDVVVQDTSHRISRLHCAIERRKRRYYLIDLSANGSQINGRPVPNGEPVLLRRGDRISLANEVVLHFR